MTDHMELVERLKTGERSNALDMAVEMAVFTPGDGYQSVRPNAAGTKLIYTRDDGRSETCWAWDWSLHPVKAIELLTALSTPPSKADRGGA